MSHRITAFVLIAVVTTGLSILLNNAWKVGGQSIPPLGSFFSPFTGFWQNAESFDQFENSQVIMEDLEKKATVAFDDRLVPHIFAESTADALFLQGYMHARYRLFQMDISTRSASGRLSEILGDVTLDRDRFNRQIGMTYAAENAIEGWKQFPEQYALLQAYSNGVNHYIKHLKPKDYPLEFKLLNYEPEPWSPYKTALFFKSMAQTLCFGHSDLQATNMLNLLGPEVFEKLYPEYNPKQSPVIPDPTDSISYNEVSHLENIDLPSDKYYGISNFQTSIPGIGSNNWAVSGEKTRNGNAILCNDPHLTLTLPSIWYELQIHTPDFNVYGVSLPGIPGIIIGFNEFLAWGMTNVSHDVLDLYEMDWANEEKTQYRLNGENHSVQIRQERYLIKGKKAMTEAVKYTIFGPVIPDEGAWKNREGLSIRWLAHDVPDRPELTVFLDISMAKSQGEFYKALDNYISPAQNFAFALNNGSVGLRVNGRLPLKPDQDGRFIKDGSQASENWYGFIPMDELPAVYQPERSFVSSANQHSTSSNYPYYYNGSFEDYRGRQVNEMLQNMDEITIEDMMRMQQNVVNLKARDALPLLLSALDSQDFGARETQILEQLHNWNYEYTHDSESATYFEYWFRDLYSQTFDEIELLADTMAVLWPEFWRLIDWIEKEPNNVFFDKIDTDEIELAPDVILLAFRQMVDKTDDLLAEGRSLNWRQNRPMNIYHMTRIPAFSAMDLPVGGHGDAINAISGQSGPSWRMVVEMDPEEVVAYGIYPGGQSGEPGSQFSKTGVAKWAQGEYFKLLYMPSYNPESTDRMLFIETFTPKVQ